MNIIDWFKNLFHKKEESNIPSKAIDFYLTSLETTAQIDNNKFKTIYYEPDPAFLSAKIDSDPRKIIFPSEFGKKINQIHKEQNNDEFDFITPLIVSSLILNSEEVNREPEIICGNGEFGGSGASSSWEQEEKTSEEETSSKSDEETSSDPDDDTD